MTRPLVSADDVLAVEPGGVLPVCANTIVTPLARDVARERGVTFTTSRSTSTTQGQPAQPPARGPGGDLEDRIRDVVAQLLGQGDGGDVGTRRPSVTLARGDEAPMAPFPFPGPPPGMTVRTGDVITSQDGSPMGVGYMTLTAGAFTWTFDYDEIQVVLEGELVLGGDGGGRVARAGDIFHVPKGSRVEFSTPTWARFVYVTHPADWGG